MEGEKLDTRFGRLNLNGKINKTVHHEPTKLEFELRRSNFKEEEIEIKCFSIWVLGRVSISDCSSGFMSTRSNTLSRLEKRTRVDYDPEICDEWVSENYCPIYPSLHLHLITYHLLRNPKIGSEAYRGQVSESWTDGAMSNLLTPNRSTFSLDLGTEGKESAVMKEIQLAFDSINEEWLSIKERERMQLKKSWETFYALCMKLNLNSKREIRPLGPSQKLYEERLIRLLRNLSYLKTVEFILNSCVM